jgi:hypothetical protein
MLRQDASIEGFHAQGKKMALFPLYADDSLVTRRGLNGA